MGNEESKSITEFVLERVLLIIIGCLGIIGNLCIIGIFTRLRNRQTFHRLMILLATFDTLYILFSFFIFSLPSIFKSYDDSAFYNYLLPVILPLNHIALTGSVYSKLSITIERYLIVCHPFYVWSHNWKARLYIIPIIIFSIVYNIPKFFEIETMSTTSVGNSSLNEINVTMDAYTNVTERSRNHSSEDVLKYGIKATELRLDLDYVSIYLIWTNFIVMCVIPFSILIGLNSLTLKGLKNHLKHLELTASSIPMESMGSESRRRSTSNSKYSTMQETKNLWRSTVAIKRRNNEISLSKISLLIMSAFIMCHSVRWVPNIYELIQHMKPDDEEFEWPEWVDSMTHVSHFLTTLNASINFYIYFFNRFKKHKLKMFLKTKFSELGMTNTCFPMEANRISDNNHS